MQKFFNKSIFSLFSLGFLLFFVCACGANSTPKHKKPKGKLQKGARIPCPIKDC